MHGCDISNYILKIVLLKCFIFKCYWHQHLLWRDPLCKASLHQMKNKKTSLEYEEGEESNGDLDYGPTVGKKEENHSEMC